jgi:hypothetical protein
MPDERKRDGQTIHMDEYGNEYALDADGNHLPPRQSRVVSKPGEFVTFDTRGGHCGLCGSISCRGGCFK